MLERLVEACLRDDVVLVCVVGDDCERVHDVINEIILGDGSPDRSEGPMTTWHTGQERAEVRKFAEGWVVEGDEHGRKEEVILARSIN